MPDKNYEDGLRDGKIEALEQVSGDHKDRLDSHSGRIRALERVSWLLLGALVLIQFWPTLQTILTGG